MNRLLKISAIIEGLTGLGLIAVPGLVFYLLFNEEIASAAIPLGRVAGVALLSLGVACWRASGDEQSRAMRGVVSAMSVYNLGAAIVLGAAGLHLPASGIALWPAVLLHFGMGIWCVAPLKRA